MVTCITATCHRTVRHHRHYVSTTAVATKCLYYRCRSHGRGGMNTTQHTHFGGHALAAPTVGRRVNFKPVTFTFKTVHGLAPPCPLLKSIVEHQLVPDVIRRLPSPALIRHIHVQRRLWVTGRSTNPKTICFVLIPCSPGDVHRWDNAAFAEM